MSSLYDSLIDYCHASYLTSECGNCNHPGCCPGNPYGNCKQCFEEVHYPSRNPLGKKDYDCDRMLYFYTCCYAAKYASEMLYLMCKSEAMAEIEDYNVLSIGCGSCPDLMALERYCDEPGSEKTIEYTGIDMNKRWTMIHNEIKRHPSDIIQRSNFSYRDAVTGLFPIIDTNVVVLQYFISHLYNNGQIANVNFFSKNS